MMRPSWPRARSGLGRGRPVLAARFTNPRPSPEEVSQHLASYKKPLSDPDCHIRRAAPFTDGNHNRERATWEVSRDAYVQLNHSKHHP